MHRPLQNCFGRYEIAKPRNQNGARCGMAVTKIAVCSGAAITKIAWTVRYEIASAVIYAPSSAAANKYEIHGRAFPNAISRGSRA
jgi:hypothetical protein